MRETNVQSLTAARPCADHSRYLFTGGDPLAPARGILVAVLATMILVALLGAGLWIGAAQMAKVSQIEQETLAGSSYRSIRTASAEADR